MGLFVESEKGRQQLAVKRTVGDWIVNTGYCLNPPEISYEMHPEQGTVWEWELNNMPEIMARLGANFQGEGPGALRKIPDESMDEIRRIFEVTGGAERFRKIEAYSASKAIELGQNLDQGIDNEYFRNIYD
jgi:heterodisulfide reductase subunit C